MNKTLYTLFSASLLCFGCNPDRMEMNADVKIPVEVQEVKRKTIEKYISTTGTVQPREEAELKAEITGQYRLYTNPRTRKPYAIGDAVKKGEVIISIEDSEYRNNIRIESKKLNLEIKEQTLEKQKALFEKGGVSQIELRNAEVDYVNSKYEYESARLQLGKMSIRMPMEGIIVDLPHTTTGIRIETGTSLVKIMNYSVLYLEVNFPEKQLGAIRKDMPVRITHYTLPEDTISGRISAISPAIDPETRTFKSTLLLDNKNLAFRPGMFVKADLVISRKEKALVIPKEIILSRQKGNTVFVIDRNIAQERVISIGLDNPDEVEVIDGLKENERLVVKGHETLANRSKVTVVK